MIPKERVSEFQRRITSMIETNTESMIDNILNSGNAENSEALRCLGRVRKGEEMLRIAKAYMK